MDSLTNRLAVLAGVIVAGTLTLLGLLLEWATWVWLPLATVLGAVTVIVLRSALHERDLHASPPHQHHAPAPAPVPPAGPAPRQETISKLPLPSREQDYHFLFSATVLWERQPHVPAMASDFGATAKKFVIERALELTQRCRPQDHGIATMHLSSSLSGKQQVVNGHYVWAADVTLELSEEDSERLEKMARLRKDRALWDEERAHELSLRDYVGKEVLRDPGTAVLWWFARNLQKPDGLTRTVNDIEKLRRLTAAAHATQVPPWDPQPFTADQREGEQPPLAIPPVVVEGNTSEPTPVQQLIDGVERLTAEAEPAVRATLQRRLVRLLHAHGLTAEANEIARRFEVVIEYPDGDEGPPSDNSQPPAGGEKRASGSGRAPDDNGRPPSSGGNHTPDSGRAPDDDGREPNTGGESTDSLPHPPLSL